MGTRIGVSVGLAPDRDTELDSYAMAVAGAHGFIHHGSSRDGTELYCRRFAGPFVDLLALVTERDKPSAAWRYARAGYPWPKGSSPEPLITVTGSLRDVIRQVLEWPTDPAS